jgi:hypothetical protein
MVFEQLYEVGRHSKLTHLVGVVDVDSGLIGHQLVANDFPLFKWPSASRVGDEHGAWICPGGRRAVGIRSATRWWAW